MLEFVKKDLGEFGTAVKNEATNVVSTAGTAVEKTFNVSTIFFASQKSQRGGYCSWNPRIPQ